MRGTPTNRDTLEGGLLNKINAQARATTNTITQAASVQANAAVGGLIFGQYEWVSVLDDRTTKICRRLDGKHWVYGRGPLPPAHVGCRSTIKPWEDGPTPDESFGAWARRQPSAFRADAFDREPGSSYEGAKPISLEEFKAKGSLILAQG
jgi:SPP1 gp7 family putative phage head morphogenesis protein